MKKGNIYVHHTADSLLRLFYLEKLYVMFHVTFWVLGILNGIYGEAIRCTPFDAFDECNLELDEFVAPLTKHKLGRFCKQVQEFYDCYDRKNRKVRNVPCGDSPFTLLSSSRYIIEDLCDKTSRTHRDFLQNLPCLRSIGDEFTLCEKKLEIMYQKYIELLKEEDFHEKEPPEALKKCLKVLYRMICVNSKIPKLCGMSSDQFFAKVIEESGILGMYCTDIDLKDAMIIIKLDQAFQKSEKPVVTLSYLFDWLEG